MRAAWSAALLPILVAGAMASPAPRHSADVGPGLGRARLLLSRPDGRLAAPSHRAAGWIQRSRLLPDGRTEVTVIVAPLVRHASPHPRPRLEDDPLHEWLGREEDQPAAIRRLAEELVHERTDQVEASAAILKWIALNVVHADEPPHDDSAAATLEARLGSCVGRSLLAVALHRAAGMPARTLHGLVVAPRPEPGPARFVLHRFVETWIDGVGWVPSDPGDSIHVVDPGHVLIALDDEPYDPETQRDLVVSLAGMEPLAVDSTPAGMRRLVQARWTPAPHEAGAP